MQIHLEEQNLEKINNYINRNKFESPLLNELMEVGFTNIWTTNFDNTIELNYQKKIY